LSVKRSTVCAVALTVAVLAGCSKNGTTTAPKTPASPVAPTSAAASGTPVATGGSQTFNGHGVSFQYPADWKPFTVSGTSASQGNQVWSESFGIDSGNFVTVSQYTVGLAITPSNIDQHSSELTTQIQNLFTQAGGSMQSGPVKLTMGGFPALGYSGTAVNPQAMSVKTKIVLAFNGTTEYFVNCQSTGTDTSALDAGCQQIVTTFTV
jgi:hypothetical protein